MSGINKLINDLNKMGVISLRIDLSYEEGSNTEIPKLIYKLMKEVNRVNGRIETGLIDTGGQKYDSGKFG